MVQTYIMDHALKHRGGIPKSKWQNNPILRTTFCVEGTTLDACIMYVDLVEVETR